jgi:hypothetical protein
VDRTDRVVNDASVSLGVAENDPAIACLLPVVAAWSYGIAALRENYCIRGHSPGPLYFTTAQQKAKSTAQEPACERTNDKERPHERVPPEVQEVVKLQLAFC